MSDRIRVLWVLVALSGGGFVSPATRVGMPAAEAAAGVPGKNRLALNFRGTGNLEPAEPGRFQYTTDLYSLITGERVGTGTNNVLMTVPIEDHVIIFHLPDGDLVAHSKQSVMPDPQYPGFALVGIHQDSNVVPERGTGAYAGRTGTATMSGWVDGSKLPEQATFNNFYLIELDPKS
jgi:hypothetical protein